jgi:hypothetical protein
VHDGLLENFCVIDIDYKILPNHEVKQTLQPRGGHNKEIIMLNIVTFKKFCLKAGTTRADEIHDYCRCRVTDRMYWCRVTDRMLLKPIPQFMSYFSIIINDVIIVVMYLI